MGQKREAKSVWKKNLRLTVPPTEYSGKEFQLEKDANEKARCPILMLPRSLGDLSPGDAGSRHFSELACISIYLKDGEQKVSKTKNKYWC